MAFSPYSDTILHKYYISNAFQMAKSIKMKPTVTIEYCPKCGWLMRAAWMAQELLTTFADDIYSLTLQPSEVNGNYIIYVDGVALINRKELGHFPEIKEVKQIIRDKVAPEKSLGHSDRK